jgi:hypothetical protein
MKPTNLNENGCDPISSNCVIWQGPDIDCIDLCKGDNVSQVVNKLAIELCTLLEMFNIDNYDVSCLNLAECAPKDFVALINLLIEKICQEEGISPAPGVSGGCPDCVVNICPEFYYTNPTGDQVTTMQLQDYVLAIGNKVCTIAGQIGTINTTLAGHNVRITALENAPAPTFVLPTLTPICVLPPVAADIDLVLAAVEAEFCQLKTATGDVTAITTAIMAACIGLSTADKLQGLGQMQDITGWNNPVQNLSQSMQNLWLTVCDMRNAITFIQNNCCDTGCSAIDLIVTASLNSVTELRLDFTGLIPLNYQDQAIGSTVEITETYGGAGPQIVNALQIKNSFDLGTPILITLSGINGALDLTVKTTYRFIDPIESVTCENLIQSIALGTSTCPSIIFTSDYEAINYAFTWNGTLPTTMVSEVWNDAQTVLLQTNVLSVTIPSPSFSFLNLTSGTTYKVRLVINGEPCAFNSVATLAYACIPVGVLPAVLSYITPEGDTNGTTITGWQAVYDAAHP